MIDIISNGSHWYGESPDTIDDLLATLATEPLDRKFEQYGNFVNPDPQWLRKVTKDGYTSFYPGLRVTSFFGNFYTTSHVFTIYTDDPDTIAKLTTAIRANQARPDYLSQKA
jgi:hypothetical protein